jgi:hypothetical protein
MLSCLVTLSRRDSARVAQTFFTIAHTDNQAFGTISLSLHLGPRALSRRDPLIGQLFDARQSAGDIAGESEREGRLTLGDSASVGGLSFRVRSMLPRSSSGTTGRELFNHKGIVEVNADVTLRNAAHPEGVSCKGVCPPARTARRDFI